MSFVKSLHSLLVCSIACEILAVQVILSGRGAFWRTSKEIMFFEIHRGAAPVSPGAVWAIAKPLQKICEPPNGRDVIFFKKKMSRGVINPSVLSSCDGIYKNYNGWR